MPIKMTTDIFIQRGIEKHGDRFDYSKVEYVNNRTKVCIICKEHGEFWQVPDSHLRGTNCPMCGEETRRKNNTSNLEEWLIKAETVHKGKYRYEHSEYKGATSPIIVTCPKHGDFIQRASDHLSGYGCPKCGYNKVQNILSDTLDDFLNKAKEVHGDKYDYSKVEYNSSKEKVCIQCKEHGDFFQQPYAHLNGQGCPNCNHGVSKWENEIYELIKYYDINIIQSDRKILNGLELDLLLPDLGIAIECDGLRWHSEEFGKDKNYHLNKTIECEKQGIKLIHIFEDEWNNKKDIVISRLLNLIQITRDKIYARKCVIREVTSKDSNIFLNNNHIQGATNSKLRYGLYYNDELVSLMTFGSLRKNLGRNVMENCYELIRFCNKLNCNVVGGASKLFKYFIKEYHPEEIISYADRRWSQGKLYNILGFELTHISSPNYFYIINDIRENRFKYRKDILVSKYGCQNEISEHDFCRSKKWYRIYDCGNYVFRYKV